MQHFIVDPIYVREEAVPSGAPRTRLALPDTIGLLGLRYPDILAVLSAINRQVSVLAQEEMARGARGPFVGQSVLLDWSRVERETQLPRHAAQLVWAWCLTAADQGVDILAEYAQIKHFQHGNPAMDFSSRALEPWFAWVLRGDEDFALLRAGDRLSARRGESGVEKDMDFAAARAGSRPPPRPRQEDDQPVDGAEFPGPEDAEGREGPTRPSTASRGATDSPVRETAKKRAPRGRRAQSLASKTSSAEIQAQEHAGSPLPSGQAEGAGLAGGTSARSPGGGGGRRASSQRLRSTPTEEEQTAMQLTKELFRLRKTILIMALLYNGPNLSTIRVRYFRRVEVCYIKQALANILRESAPPSRPLSREQALSYTEALLALEKSAFKNAMRRLFPTVASMGVTQELINSVYNQHSLVELQATGTFARHYTSAAVRGFEFFGFTG